MATIQFLSWALSWILTYSNSGWTTRARLEGRVQGVVVQARKAQSTNRGGGQNRTLVVLALEGDDDGGVGDVLVVEVGLKVGEGGGAGGTEGHHTVTSVDESLLVEGLEGPPLGLHVPGLHGLVAMVEVDPTAETADDLLPLVCVSGDDLAALGVVARDGRRGGKHTWRCRSCRRPGSR